jgi:hypothetical protein
MFLHDAVRPPGSRDDAGVKGEALHILGDALQVHVPTLTVSGSSPRAVWQAVDDCIKSMSAEESFRHNHFVALACLEEYARLS